MPSADNKRIAKNTLMLYFRMLLLMCISLYTSRVVLEKLGVADFGLYNVVGGIISLLSFLNGAMATTNQRFFSFELGRKDFVRLRLVFNQSMIAHIGIGLVFFVLAETVGLWFVCNKLVVDVGSRTSAMWVYQTMVLQFFLTVYTVPYNAAIVAHERMEVFAAMGIVEALLKLLVAFSIGLFSGNRLIWFSVIMLCSSIITAFGYVIYGRIKFDECRFSLMFDRDILKSLTGFAGWSIFGSVAWIAKGQGVNVVLNMFFGTLVNAAFGVANQVNAAVGRFVQTFSTAMNPQIVKTYAVGDYVAFHSILQQGSRYAFLLLFVLSYPVMACISGLLSVWLVEVPAYADVFSRMIICVSLLESFTYPIGTAIQATGKIKWYQIIVGVTLFMNVPLSWLALRAGMSAPCVFVIANVIAFVALLERLIIMRRILPCFSARHYAVNVFLRPAVVCLIGWAVCRTMSFVDAVQTLGLWELLPSYACVGAVLTYGIGLTRKERIKFVSLVKSKIKYGKS